MVLGISFLSCSEMDSNISFHVKPHAGFILMMSYNFHNDEDFRYMKLRGL